MFRREQQRAAVSKNMRVTERRLSRLLAGTAATEDSDSSRGEDMAGSGERESLASCTDQERSVADLSKTCGQLQSQVALARFYFINNLPVYRVFH